MTVAIISAGILVGIEAEITRPEDYPLLDVLDNVILAIFTLEIVVKIVALGKEPHSFFRESWNVFDFIVVFTCLVFLLPVAPKIGSLVSMLRLIRLLRILKLTKAFPQLRIIVEALVSSLGSMIFVIVLLFMYFYLSANIAMILFGRNDPMHFGTLQSALMTLFRLATLDAWSDVM